MSEVSLVDGHIDNTMTDEDIIEAVDKCASIGESCEGCPFYDYTDCDKRLKENFHSLIKRKNAEIEKLEYDNVHWNDWEVKCRAIKEFAERLKFNIDEGELYGKYYDYIITMEHIDNLVKEMTDIKE